MTIQTWKGGSHFKPCWNCLRLRLPALQFDKGFICFDCGLAHSKPVIRQLTRTSTLYSDLAKYLTSQAVKSRKYKPENYPEPKPLPLFVLPLPANILLQAIEAVADQSYPLHYLGTTLEMLTRGRTPVLERVSNPILEREDCYAFRGYQAKVKAGDPELTSLVDHCHNTEYALKLLRIDLADK